MKRTFSSRLVTLWRKLIRAAAMSPVRGYYRCLTCPSTARFDRCGIRYVL